MVFLVVQFSSSPILQQCGIELEFSETEPLWTRLGSFKPWQRMGKDAIRTIFWEGGRGAGAGANPIKTFYAKRWCKFNQLFC